MDTSFHLVNDRPTDRLLCETTDDLKAATAKSITV
jgi:hypothetical protein